MADSTEKIDRSWRMLNGSIQVIARNKRLLQFPVLSLGCVAGLACLFFLPAAFYSTGQPWTDPQHWQKLMDGVTGAGKAGGIGADSTTFKAAIFGYFAILYVMTMTVTTFWNVAFYHEILKALAGEEISVSEGLRFARQRLRSIVMWSLLAGLVGLIIRGLERNFGPVGRLVPRVVGLSWSVAAVFVIPVMIREESGNPLTLLKHSVGTLKKTWGETLIGFAGIGFVGLSNNAFVFGGIMLMLVIGVAALWLEYWALMVVALAGFLVVLIGLVYVVAAAGDVYRCALYVYATEGVAPLPFDAGMMDGAWEVKRD